MTQAANFSSFIRNDALNLPQWTTGTRPTAATGLMGWNTTLSVVEVYNGTAWVVVGEQSIPYSIEYLVVAGGGAGNDGFINANFVAGGGGGAGGMLTGSTTVNPLNSLSVTIGAGGPYAFVENAAANGSNSSLGALATAIGGGGGGKQSRPGASGGSGGGGGGNVTGAGTGTAGQGNNGGDGSGNSTGGGGGGKGSAGGTPTAGSGSAWSDGVTYAAGGTGGFSGSGNGTNGTANRGNGGTGAEAGSGRSGGNGGSGIVIIRYPGSQKGTGGTVTSSGGYTYHTFTTSGTYTA